MQRKRIILMYISEVSGHHSATNAIEKALKALSPQSEVLNINGFNYTNPISEKIVNTLYMSVIKRTPKLWDYLYDNPRVAKKLDKLKNTVNKLNSPKLKRLFDRFKPDAVACTQAFPCGMVADYKKVYDGALPLVAVLTDFAPHAYWVYDNIDYYVTPSEEVSQRLIKKGVDAAKIRLFGIPFDHTFNDPVDTAAVFKKLKLEQGVSTILIMGGGHGLGPIRSIVKSLEKIKAPTQEIIVTGTNKKLYRILKRRKKKYKKKIALFRYTETINELMSVSDLIVTKPGGITTAEALSKKLPLIIVKPIPGQETSNTAYLTGQNAAIKVTDPKNIHLVIESLINTPGQLETYRESAAAISKPRSSMDIAKFLLEL